MTTKKRSCVRVVNIKTIKILIFILAILVYSKDDTEYQQYVKYYAPFKSIDFSLPAFRYEKFCPEKVEARIWNEINMLSIQLCQDPYNHNKLNIGSDFLLTILLSQFYIAAGYGGGPIDFRNDYIDYLAALFNGKTILAINNSRSVRLYFGNNWRYFMFREFNWNQFSLESGFEVVLRPSTPKPSPLPKKIDWLTYKPFSQYYNEYRSGIYLRIGPYAMYNYVKSFHSNYGASINIVYY